jgi:hypothetical protein
MKTEDDKMRKGKPPTIPRSCRCGSHFRVPPLGVMRAECAQPVARADFPRAFFAKTF